MRCGMFALLMVMTGTISVRADDSAAARALVDKAVKAQGGEDKLGKYPAVTAKIKGKFHGLGDPLSFTGELAFQSYDRNKFVIEGEACGEKIRLVHVLNGDKGWTRINDETEELDADDIAEAKEEAFAEWVTTLIPLKDKKFSLALQGEIKIDERPAFGVRVSSKGHRDINLYFDKETGLLVKTETRVKDDSNQEVTEETLLSDYKEVQGTKQAMKFTVKRDGKLYLEGEVTEYRLVEKLDEAVFAKP